MKSITKILFVVFAFICCSGCVDVETLIKVKTDGSGTVEESMVMTKEMADQMEKMAEQMKAMKNMPGNESSQNPPEKFKILDDKKLAEVKNKAKEMGEDVEFSSVKEIENKDGSKGYKAIYAFKDINKLGLASADSKSNKQNAQNKKITFKFTKGSPATLVVTMPPADKKEEAQKQPKQAKTEPDEAQIQKMMKTFKGMRICNAIEVQGQISETDASFKEGSRITLVEMNMDKLFENKEASEKLFKSNPGSLEETQKILGDVLGLKLESKKEITVKFK